jgi:hypothetical protein
MEPFQPGDWVYVQGGEHDGLYGIMRQANQDLHSVNLDDHGIMLIGQEYCVP